MSTLRSEENSGLIHFAVYQQHSPGHGMRPACGVKSAKTTDKTYEVTCTRCRTSLAFTQAKT